jgi:hypothetical protein
LQLLPTLPYPPRSTFTREMVREIKAIPNDEIRYSQEEVELLERAIQNLDFMLEHSVRLGLETDGITTRRKEVEVLIEVARKNLQKPDPSGSAPIG